MTISKQTYRSGPYKDLIANGVKVGNVLYLSGQVGIDAAGVVGDGIAEQARLAYVNIQEVLSKFGATMDNIVDETVFVTDMSEIMSNIESVYGHRAAAYAGLPEVCQTLVQVAALVMPELKIEIKCIAHL